MTIQRFEVPGLAQYSYLISSGREAIVIDPIRDIDRYLEHATRLGLGIAGVLETHIHADFASGGNALAQVTGAELVLSAHDAGERYRYAMPHRPLSDGESFAFGDLRLQALHTPGHTPEHLSFLLFDRESQPLALFSGDFLFSGSLGRPDLLGEDAKLGLAHDLHTSLRHRIAELPDELAVYPGHGAGSFCGAGMSDRPETTLGIERAGNPFFHLSEEEFVQQILASVPPMPTYYPRMKELNSAGAPILAEIPGETPLQPKAVSELKNKTLLDLRAPEDFAACHIPGSINIGSGSSLSLWAGWLLDPGQPIVLIGDAEGDSAACLSLLRVGLDTAIGYLAGGVPAWVAAGLPSKSIPLIDSEQLAPTGELILDVRNPSERAHGAISDSLNIPLGDLPNALSQLSSYRSIVAVCAGGYRASTAASLLTAAGFSTVSILRGGMTAWSNRSRPAEANSPKP